MTLFQLPRRRLVIVTIGLQMGMILASLDASIVQTAMPHIVSELSGIDLYAWVSTGYLVAATTIIPISGRLGDLFGRRRFALLGMIGFVAASALCGFAPTMLVLVLLRVVQGVFGGFLTSSVISSMADLYTPATRARMQGVFASAFAVSSLIGPTLGGFITDGLGWRWVFYLNLPLGLLAVSIVALTMPRITVTASRSDIDYRGAFLLAAGLVPLLCALSVTQEIGWRSPVVLGLGAAGILLLLAFVQAERTATHPILPLSLFRNPTFTISVIVSFLGSFGMFGASLYVPLLSQGVLGLTATASGLLLMPRVLVMVCTSLLTGQVISRVRRYRFIGAFGMCLIATGLFLLSRVDATSGQGEVVRDLMLMGMGFGTNTPIYQNAVMSSVPRSVMGVASSQVQFSRSMGQTVGVASLGLILATGLPEGGARRIDEVVASVAARQDLAASLNTLFLVSAIIVSIGAVVAFFLKEVPFRGSALARAEPEAEAGPTVAGALD